MLPLLLFAKLQHQGKQILFRHAKKLPVILDPGGLSFLEKAGHDKALLYHGNHDLQLLPDLQIPAPLFPPGVNQLHGPLQDRHDLPLVHRLVQVIQHAQVDSLFRVVELVVGRHDDKNKIGVVFPDLLHRLDSVDSGHLDIHKGDIRAEALRQLDDAASRLRGDNLAPIPEILPDDIGQGINDDSLVVCQHNLIHDFLLPPLPDKAGTGAPPYPCFRPRFVSPAHSLYCNRGAGG